MYTDQLILRRAAKCASANVVMIIDTYWYRVRYDAWLGGKSKFSHLTIAERIHAHEILESC